MKYLRAGDHRQSTWENFCWYPVCWQVETNTFELSWGDTVPCLWRGGWWGWWWGRTWSRPPCPGWSSALHQCRYWRGPGSTEAGSRASGNDLVLLLRILRLRSHKTWCKRFASSSMTSREHSMLIWSPSWLDTGERLTRSLASEQAMLATSLAWPKSPRFRLKEERSCDCDGKLESFSLRYSARM